MRVIPSRADGEGPHNRSIITQITTNALDTHHFVDREAFFA
ncbi:MAG: hypothetical protein QOH88_366 [Verrucomicrobiota bacterium]|jgi:hypothetical protein